MHAVKRFAVHNRSLLLIAAVLSMALVSMISPAAAQSLDTSAFQSSITEGMQTFFDNLPVFVGVGFAVFAVIYAFIAGLRFAKTLLMEVLKGLQGGN